MKILALCDSPTLTSGFARVAQNLFKRWSRAGAVIDVWGICFMGMGYKEHSYLNQIFPAGGGGEWCRPERLQIFLQQLAAGGYTHVWLMQDTFLLANHDFPRALKDVCTQKKIRSLLYFPVDAPLKPEWTDIIACVDVAVAYTEYGRAEALGKFQARMDQLARAALAPGAELNTLTYDPLVIHVLPHGVDATTYRPMPERLLEREKFWSVKWVGPDDFLMINVNSHQRRKDITRSLEILKTVKAMGVPAKLLLHMSAVSDQDVNIETVGEQLGLTLFTDWAHHGQLFNRSQVSLPELPTAGSSSMLQLYNLADLYLTTTLGEGWGLGITEALACGTPVAMPDHTACGEIGTELYLRGMGRSRVMLPLEPGYMVQEMDNSRCRPRVDVGHAARAIKDYYDAGHWRARQALAPAVRQWLSWDRIAAEMLKLLRGPK